MIISAPPLQVGEQVRGSLSRRPGATSQRGYSVTDGQIHPLNRGGIEPSREAHFLQGGLEICQCPQAH